MLPRSSPSEHFAYQVPSCIVVSEGSAEDSSESFRRHAASSMTQIVKHLATAYTGQGSLPSPHLERIGWPHQLKAAAEAVGEQLPGGYVRSEPR